MILYCRRIDSVLVEQGKPDWVQCDPVLPDKRLHPTEKPVELIKTLLRRVAIPGQTLLDPFLGSGAIIDAGLSLNII
jgi:DNA modification methylase